MASNKHQTTSVLFGDELKTSIQPDISQQYIFTLPGTTNDGAEAYLPITEATLSKHIMLLGGIGTGKSNAFYHIISRLQDKTTANDVMVIFDTKGDF